MTYHTIYCTGRMRLQAPCWYHFEAILRRPGSSSRALLPRWFFFLWPPGSHLGAHRGAAQDGMRVDTLSQPSWCYLGLVVGPNRALLELLCSVLGPSWAMLGPRRGMCTNKTCKLTWTRETSTPSPAPAIALVPSQGRPVGVMLGSGGCTGTL